MTLAVAANLLGLLIVALSVAACVFAAWAYDWRLGVAALAGACGAVGWRLTQVTDGGA